MYNLLYYHRQQSDCIGHVMDLVIKNYVNKENMVNRQRNISRRLAFFFLVPSCQWMQVIHTVFMKMSYHLTFVPFFLYGASNLAFSY